MKDDLIFKVLIFESETSLEPSESYDCTVKQQVLADAIRTESTEKKVKFKNSKMFVHLKLDTQAVFEQEVR
jgi:hypothetical protein